MPSKKQPPVTVVRAQDGAIIRADLDLKAARIELDQLNREAAQNGHRHLGEQIRYEIRSASGLVVT